MNAERLLELFEKVGEAPGAVERLRGLVLDLAVHGRLHTQQNLSRRSTRAAGGRESVPDVPSRAFPHGWRLVPISKLADGGGLFTDGDWVESKDQDPAGDVRLIQLADVGHGEYRDRSARFMRSEVANRMGCTFLRPGDVLVARMPEPIGRACIFPGDSKPAVTVVDVVVLRIERSDVVPRYVVYALNSPSMLRQAMARAAGATRSRISKGNLGRLLFALPPVAEQRAVIARVDELMSLCDQLEVAQVEREKRRNQVVSASLQRLREPVDEPAVFREHAAFHLRHMGRMTTRVEHVRELREALLAMAVRGSLGQSPRAKDAVRLGSVASLQNGYAFKSEWFEPTGVRLLRNINVSPGGLRWDEVAHISEERADALQRFALKKGDIVLSLDRPFIANGTKVSRVSEADGSCLLLQRVGRFVVDTERLDEDFLFLWLQSEVFSAQLNPGRSNGVPHVSSKEVQATLIWVPSLDEQRAAVSRANELLMLCDQLQRVLHTDAGRRSALLEHAIQDALRTG